VHLHRRMATRLLLLSGLTQKLACNATLGADDFPAPFRLVVVAPVYEDAPSAVQLLKELAVEFAPANLQLHVLLVDDGSREPLSETRGLADCIAVPVDVLVLRRNVGHQRAIALGVAYVHDQIPCEAMLVMDADGEDRPQDARRLVDQFRASRGQSIIFAERTRRSESLWFRVLYRAYQLMHWALTGIRVRVGNFSIVPGRALSTLVTLPAMWNHYAAAVFDSRLTFQTIPTERGLRQSGRSKMNSLALVMHGLHAISVFSDLVAVRFLIIIVGLCCLCGGVLGGAFVAQFYSKTATPLWALYGWGLLLLLVLLAVGSFSLVLNLLSQRNSLNFLPIRDYRYFIDRIVRVNSRHE
jgi:glycosyltransferase involved in cell wall biosynthesis